MTDYDIEWHINSEEECASPQEAAEQAWEALRRDDSIANAFVVKDSHDMAVIVDLHEKTVGEPVWTPSHGAMAELAEWMIAHDWDTTEVIAMIRRPHRYAAEYTQMRMDQAYDVVAKEPEVADLDEDSVSSTKVHFQSEMWDGDYAVAIQTDWSQDTWNVTVETEERLQAIDLEAPCLDLDWVRDDSNAPQWIKDWAGPFTITVEEKGWVTT